MNEELANKLADVIGSIQNSVGKATDFAVDQLPDVAQQYLMYGRVYFTAIVVLSTIVLIASIAILVVQVKKAQAASYDEGPHIVAYFVAGVTGIFSFLAVAASMNTAFLVWFAPKIFILQGLAGLLK